MRPIVPRPWIIPVVAAVLLALLLLAAPRSARAHTGGYVAHEWSGCAAGTNGGSWDDAGRLYVPCGSPATIGIYDAAGRLVQRVAAGRAATEVAPTRDGRYIYVAGPGSPVSRLARAADGSYAPDPAWQPRQYVIWGSSWYAPLGHYLAVDRAGHVYVSHGMWVPGSPHTVIKYRPDGTVVTRFGEWNETWAAGEFYWSLAGIAVSDDGATVYTAEVGNDRVQAWERQPNGSYVSNPARIFGDNAANTPDRNGGNDCNYVGLNPTLAAVYDVSLDPAGNLYVLNTTCKQVLKFSPGFGALLANLDVRVPGTDIRPHGMAVAADGSVWVGENRRVWRPAGAARPDAPPTRVTPAPAPKPAPVTPTPRPSRPPVSPNLPALDLTAPRVSLPARGVRAVRTRRAGRQVLAAPRCTERCRVELRVQVRGRTITRRVRWLARNQRATIPARIPARMRRGQRAVVVLRFSDRAGNARTLRRAVTLR